MRTLTDKLCAECGAHFLASRPAWLCSSRCRQRAYRGRVASIAAAVLAQRTA